MPPKWKVFTKERKKRRRKAVHVSQLRFKSLAERRKLQDHTSNWKATGVCYGAIQVAAENKLLYGHFNIKK